MTLIVKPPENQLRMSLANSCLAIRCDEIINFFYLIANIPKLTGNTHSWTFMSPIMLVGGGLI